MVLVMVRFMVYDYGLIIYDFMVLWFVGLWFNSFIV